MGPKKRFKITCLECGVDMDHDYRIKHNRLFHASILKEHKVIRYQTLNAPKDPFAAARPAKVPRTSEPVHETPTTSTVTTEKVLPSNHDGSNTPTVNDRLLSKSTTVTMPDSPLNSTEQRGNSWRETLPTKRSNVILQRGSKLEKIFSTILVR